MTPTPSPQGRIYTFKTLSQKGIDLCPNHIRRLVKAGKFPAPFYLSERVPAWTEAALDSWVEGLEKEARSRNIDRRISGSTPVLHPPPEHQNAGAGLPGVGMKASGAGEATGLRPTASHDLPQPAVDHFAEISSRRRVSA